jgi:hypothetical protein
MVDVASSNSHIHGYVDGTLGSTNAVERNVKGERYSVSPFARMIVLEVICDPTIVDQNQIDKFKELGITNMMYAKSLPRNTIVAQMVADGSPGSARQPMFLFPFFSSHVAMPVKPGEHVWVLLYPDFEKRNASLGYWMSRIVEPNFVDDVNHTHAPRTFDSSYVKGTLDEFNGTGDTTYDFPNGSMEVSPTGERNVVASSAPLVNCPFVKSDKDAYKELIQNTNAGRLSQIEPVPRFRKRPGDLSLEGSNNTLIVLGTDRKGPVAAYNEDPDYLTKIAEIPSTDFRERAGMIDLVVGRGATKRTLGKTAENELSFKEIAKTIKNDDATMLEEGDLDFKDDRARVALFQKTKIDEKLSLTSFNNAELSIEDSAGGDSVVVVKADKLRFVARKDIEFLVTSFETDAEGNVTEVTDQDKMCAIVLKTNGEIVFRPSKTGVIKLGSDNANKAIVCTDQGAAVNDGVVSAAPIVSTMAGFIATMSPGQGTYAKKVLVD